MTSPFALRALTVRPSALPAPSKGIVSTFCDGSRFRRITFHLAGSITVGVEPQLDNVVLFSFQTMPLFSDLAAVTRSNLFEQDKDCPSSEVNIIEQNSFSTAADRLFSALLWPLITNENLCFPVSTVTSPFPC
ncbi:MAG: hypothetical protein GWN94_05445 [Phycisphaerae bacterium]|nr:hypothetical protein [Phycisphaerae bacterium]NIW97746.1 hypothetical protein [Phycisphaerae bacterium]